MNAIETATHPRACPLADAIGKLFIIAYKESTEQLETALTHEGFSCEVIRQQDSAETANFSPSYRCLLNHRRAWEKALEEPQPTLMVEADFVPVVGMGKLPLPFPPDSSKLGISWLYTCAPQIYTVSDEGYAEGFSTSMVAYVITAESAKFLIELAEHIRETIGPTNYSTWDSEIDTFLRQRQLKNYVPFRNYGEHGGRPNPEHRQNKLSTSHRADVLYGKLAFVPMYAETENATPFTYLYVRGKARLKGLARLAVGKYLRLPVVRNSSFPARLLSFAIRRQFSLKP